MSDNVKAAESATRSYHSPKRLQQAAGTRRAILQAARDLFASNGYAATTVTDIARRADVSLDTVYAAVGRKPAVLRELVETAISGTDQAVAAEQRDYVAQIRATSGAGAKLAIYARALVGIQQRMAPVFLALRDAAAADSECAALWTEIAERRAANMRLLATDLRDTGELRDDLSNDQVADIIWSMNAAEFWLLLVRDRGWTPGEVGEWLADAWARLLLRSG